MIDIDSLLKKGENANFQAKLAAGGLPESMWETYSSFANTYGGVILLGIEKDMKTHKLTPRGVADPDKMISDIWNVLNDPLRVSSNILKKDNVYNAEYNGMNIVVIEIPKASRHDRPVYINNDLYGGYYKRFFIGDYHCTKEDIFAMLREQV